MNERERAFFLFMLMLLTCLCFSLGLYRAERQYTSKSKRDSKETARCSCQSYALHTYTYIILYTHLVSLCSSHDSCYAIICITRCLCPSLNTHMVKKKKRKSAHSTLRINRLILKVMSHFLLLSSSVGLNSHKRNEEQQQQQQQARWRKRNEFRTYGRRR